MDPEILTKEINETMDQMRGAVIGNNFMRAIELLARADRLIKRRSNLLRTATDRQEGSE